MSYGGFVLDTSSPALARCPVCGFLVELVEVAGDLPFEVRCRRPGCPVAIQASHEDYVLTLWQSQAAIPRDVAAGGFEIVNFEYDAPPAPPKDSRLRGLVRALSEIEQGGPNPTVRWGPAGMSTRARQALEEAGLLSESARKRFEREQKNTIKSESFDI